MSVWSDTLLLGNIGITAADNGKVVANGTLVPQTARASDITQNGTYDTTLNNEVTVDVSLPGADLFDFMADCFSIGSTNGYRILSGMYLSHSAGDCVTANGRYFTRTVATPALIVLENVGLGGNYYGYALYSPDENAFEGTYGELGALDASSAQISPAGNTYYRARMRFSFAEHPVSNNWTCTVSNGNVATATLENISILLNNKINTSVITNTIGTLMDILFF